MGYTEEQKRAIYTQDSNLLVAAAAGSGKTAVLVERIINLITNGKNNKNKPVSVDRLLVVTFTEAAAGEMRQRITEALIKKLEDDPESELLRKQIAILNKASISTIHSFCLDVVHSYFYLIDLDPNFRIADQTEMQLLKSQILEEIFETEYAKEQNDDFLQLVESYGGKKTKDDDLGEIVLNIYNFVSNIPWWHEWLEEKTEMFNIKDYEDLSNTLWFKIIKESIISTLYGVLESIDYAIKICESPNGPNQYLETLYCDKVEVEQLIKKCDTSFLHMYRAFNEIQYKTLSRKKGEGIVFDDLKEQVKKIRDDEVKGVIKRIKEKNFIKPPEFFLKDLQNIYPVLKTLSNIIKEFAEQYKNAKKERNLVDFNDLEHYCLEILIEKDIDKNEFKPSSAALELREKFEEIMIDEYQDSNQIQELILSSIERTDVPNRFMVGDIKQSIYRFRRANPEIFLQKYNSYSHNDNSKNIRIDLYKNFRSRKVVLDFINLLFYQLMTEDVGEINYDEKVALYAGADFPDTDDENISTDVEVYIGVEKSKKKENEYEINEEEEIELISKAELEAKIIAMRILEMVEGKNKLQVVDKKTGNYRDVAYSDIIIIMRSVKSVADVFIDVLKRYNIPVFADNGGNYFDSIEVSTILSFLQIIDNPRQDVHLITVLRSPVYMFSSDELLEIRHIKLQCDFYDCIMEYIESGNGLDFDIDWTILKKLQKFIGDLDRWRKIAVYTSVTSILSIIYSDTDYFNYLGVMPGGNIRQANLRALQEKATTYEATSLKGLFNFIRYIEKLKKSADDFGDAKITSENENLVKIMTIHKSKGLEFPVVFVSMLGRKFSVQDERQTVILHHKLGFGATYVDIENRIKTKTLASIATSHKVHQENLSEEMRMLYVALTRAKEKLILTGCTSNIEKSLFNWQRYISLKEKEIPQHYMLKADNFLDWICPALARHRCGDAIRLEHVVMVGNKQIYDYCSNFKIFVKTQEEIDEEENLLDKKANEIYNRLKNISENADYSGKTKDIYEKFAWQYPLIEETTLPSKISISEIKRIYQNEITNSYTTQFNLFENNIIKEPEFLKENKPATNVQLGTIVHTMMEHLDLSIHKNEHDITKLLDSLIKSNIIQEEVRELIPIKKIVNFANSPLAQRMRNSNSVKKEFPFVMGLSPYEVYRQDNLKDSKGIILVHGIIDCYFEENDEIIIVDYKTDFFKSINQIKDKYSIQLNLYKKALERSTGKRVKECIIYLFHTEEEIYI